MRQLVDAPARIDSKRDRFARSASVDELNRIVAGCQNGDRESQRLLFEFCVGTVHRLTLRVVGTEDAEDVTQQVFLQVLAAIGSFNGKSQFETWLYRLTLNAALQHQRRARTRVMQPLPQESFAEEDDFARVDHRDLLEHALQCIDPELRAVFLLKEAEGLSYSAIAKTLEIQEGTVGSRLNRARIELRRILSRE